MECLKNVTPPESCTETVAGQSVEKVRNMQEGRLRMQKFSRYNFEKSFEERHRQ